MKLKTKIPGIVLLVMLIFIAGNTFTVIKIKQMQINTAKIASDSIPSLNYIGNINTEVSDIPRLVEYYSLENDMSKRVAIETDLNAAITAINNNLKLYEALINQAEERQVYEAFLQAFDTYQRQIPDILGFAKANDNAAALRKIIESNSAWDNANNDLDSLTAIILQEAKITSQDTNHAARSAFFQCIFLSALAIVSGSLLAFSLYSGIAKSLRALQAAAAKLADGDLRSRIPVNSRDELGELAKTFNKMVNDLSAIVREVSTTANNLGANSEELSQVTQQAATASEQVAASINKLAQAALVQTKSVQETGQIIDQLNAAANQVSLNAENVNNSSDNTANAAQTGAAEVENAIVKMEEVKSVTAEISKIVDILSNYSLKIGQIVGVIKGIAAQTNLLALNAAIEAARAGEHGRGFAVVADEVSKLAEQSALSAQQIESLIADIQKETAQAVEMMAREQIEVHAGVVAVNSAGTAFKTIVAEIDNVVEQVRQMFTAMRQMTGGTAQAVNSVKEIGLIAEQNAGSSQEMAAAFEAQSASLISVNEAAGELAKFSQGLMQLIAKFQL
jgi:methyl-accepting chemotaxis protein